MLDRQESYTWHWWLNSLKDHDSMAYEWKRALEELGRLPELFRRERLGLLPKQHRQCSMSKPVPVVEKLTCALGVEVSKCEILASLSKSFQETGKKFYPDMADESLDRLKAYTCVGHILQEASKAPHAIDTSEGYILTESDRRYWDHVHKSMSLDEPTSQSKG